MPIDDFRNTHRPINRLDGVVNNHQRRPISAHPDLNGRRLDNFRRPEGYHPVRKEITSSGTISSGKTPISNPQLGASSPSSLLYKNLSGNKYTPLLSETNQNLPKANRKRKIKRWAKRASLAIGASIVIIGSFLFIKSYINLHQVFGGGSKAAALQQSNVGRVNILLLGIGGSGHDGPDLTDTMLVASIDPVNNKAVLLSVPRDLWVKMPNDYEGEYQKINAAYESGKYSYLGEESDSNSNQKAIEAGFGSVDSIVGQVLGVTINYNVLVDFQAFQQAVNDVGGVTVDVPTELYDPTMAWQNNWNPVLAEPGVQAMDGSKALLYVRSRETTSDFARTDRQRTVLVAIKNKALSLGTLSNPLKISSLLSAFGDNVRTDMSLSDAETLYGIMKRISNNNIQSVDLSTNNLVTTGTVDGLSIVEPTAGPYDYSAIQAFTRGLFRNGHLIKENAKILVLNGTNTPGLATQAADTLKAFGYPSVNVGDAPDSDYSKTIIVDLTNGRDKYTKADLQKRFHATVVTKLPDTKIQPNGANFVIIVGEDEATGG